MLPGFKLTELLNINPDDGTISFRGNRMLLFQSDALCELRQEMIHTLGEDIARGMLARFGYRCGLNDVTTFRNYFDFESDADWMLAGPLMHTLEGIVHATTEVLEYDRQKGTFYMTGIWRNSYEAEHHLKLYGPAKEPVCWTLSGYASGFGTGFMGRKVICVETMCQGKGDPYCRFELRSLELWDGEASRNINDLKQCSVIKSLQKMVAEERGRATLWWGMSNAMLDISENLDSTGLPEKLVRYAKELMAAQKASLAIVTEKTKRVLIYKVRDDTFEIETEVLTTWNHPLSVILKTGQPYTAAGTPPRRAGPDGASPGINVVGVPLYSKKRLIGALAVADKKDGEPFSSYEQEFLTVLGNQAAMALDNARLYERTNEKLQEKVTELYKLNKLLNEEKATLQKSAEVHKKLTALVLEGQGLEKISINLSQMIDQPVLVADQLFQILATSHPEVFESITAVWNTAVKNPVIRSKLNDQAAGTHLFRFENVGQSENGRKNIVVLPVIAGSDFLGYLATLEAGHPLSELDCIALERAATVIALEMLKQKATFETGQRLRKEFFTDLLQGRYESEEALRRQGVQLGLDPGREYRAIQIDIAGVKEGDGANEPFEPAPGAEHILAAVDRAVKVVNPEAFLTTEKKSIIGILPVTGQSAVENGPGELKGALERELAGSLAEYSWWAGIGSSRRRLGEFAGSHKEACAVIDIGKTLNVRNRCLFYEELGIYSILNVNSESFREFVRRVIGPLVDYDEKNKSQLVNTLKVYFNNNCNLQKAARNGFLSPATMKYRLKRIAEIGRIDLNNAESALLVHLALRLIDGI